MKKGPAGSLKGSSKRTRGHYNLSVKVELVKVLLQSSPFYRYLQ